MESIRASSLVENTKDRLPRQARHSTATVHAHAGVFFYTGPNPKNKTGVSWKVWAIAQQGREVTAQWGSARLANRRPVPYGKLRSKTWAFSSHREATDFAQLRIREKLAKGYYPL